MQLLLLHFLKKKYCWFSKDITKCQNTQSFYVFQGESIVLIVEIHSLIICIYY